MSVTACLDLVEKLQIFFFHAKCIWGFVDNVVVSTNLLRDSE